MSAPLTPFQQSLAAFGAVLDEARVTLDARSWATLIEVLCVRIGTEAARLIMADLLGEHDDEAAAA